MGVFHEQRNFIRQDEVKKNIKTFHVKQTNVKMKKKSASKYTIGDLLAIQKTQINTGLKLSLKFFDTYKIQKINP